MSRHSNLRSRVIVALGTVLLSGAGLACEEDSKPVPSTCPKLPIYDIQGGAAEFDDPQGCVTDIGHAITMVKTGKTDNTSQSGSSGTGATSSGATSSGGSMASGDTPAGAGAGGS